MSNHRSWPDWLRPFQTVLFGAVDWLALRGVRPNTLTWLSLVPALGSMVAVADGQFYLAILMMALSGLCDLLDGSLARRSGQTSLFGALLDSTLDRFADSAPLLGLIYFYAPWPQAALAAAMAVFAGYSVSYVRARAEGLNIALPPLWMRRTTRLVFTGIALVLAPISIPGVATPAPVTLLVVCALGALSIIAAGHALLTAARILQKQQKA